jgi:hypothetical protein
MTSNSPDRWRRDIAVLTTAIAVGAGCATTQASPVAPDAPVAVAPAPPRPPSEDSSDMAATLEITDVVVRPPTPELAKLAGETFLKNATEPLAIEVRTVRPLPKRPRDTSAIIIWNGARMNDTWSILPNRLVAFLPNRKTIKEVNAVTAAWSGDEQRSASQPPLTVKAADVGT